jgi:hypothetical protein
LLVASFSHFGNFLVTKVFFGQRFFLTSLLNSNITEMRPAFTGRAPFCSLQTISGNPFVCADQEAELRQAESLPQPPPGTRPGSPADRLFREEAYQTLRGQLTAMRTLLRDYNEQKRQQFENMKKEMMSATPAPKPLADSA